MIHCIKKHFQGSLDWYEPFQTNPISVKKSGELREQDVFSFYPKLLSCGQNDIGLMKNVFHSIVTTTGKPVGLPTRRIPLHQEEE